MFKYISSGYAVYEDGRIVKLEEPARSVEWQYADIPEGMEICGLSCNASSNTYYVNRLSFLVRQPSVPLVNHKDARHLVDCYD